MVFSPCLQLESVLSCFCAIWLDSQTAVCTRRRAFANSPHQLLRRNRPGSGTYRTLWSDLILGDTTHAGNWCASSFRSGQKRYSTTGNGARSEADWDGNCALSCRRGNDNATTVELLVRDKFV